MQVSIGDKVRFIHSSKGNVDKTLTGKIREHIGTTGELIEVCNDEGIRSLNGTLCHRNNKSIIEVI